MLDAAAAGVFTDTRRLVRLGSVRLIARRQDQRGLRVVVHRHAVAVDQLAFVGHGNFKRIAIAGFNAEPLAAVVFDLGCGVVAHFVPLDGLFGRPALPMCLHYSDAGDGARTFVEFPTSGSALTDRAASLNVQPPLRR